MLRLLEVQNLALIDNLSFYPGEGLNVITGETGAGKSMLLGAVSILLGERASQEAIRSGEESALMQAVFTKPEGLELEACDGEELTICREIRKNGPNICRVNGLVQPLSAMSTLSQRLVDLHGQNRQQSLLNPVTQRELLDSCGGKEIADLLTQVGQFISQCNMLQRQLTALGGDDAALARHADFLKFQLSEIEVAALSVNEESELEKLLHRLTHARQLAERTAKAYTTLADGDYEGAILDRLGLVEKELAAAAGLDEELAEILDRVATVTEQLTAAARELRTYHDGLSLDEAELDEVITRLEHYKKIKQKYGPTVADVETLAEQLQAELDSMAERSDKSVKLEQELNGTQLELGKCAAKLSLLRKNVAGLLVKQISEALQSLALPGAQFEIMVDSGQSISSHGADHVEFYFTANAGEPLRPLAKTASGGEVSRVMLAIKSVLAMVDAIPTLIFDEIDAGIGGRTVRAVAERLVELAQHRQVICVTHQPLIAAAANHHFTIYKEKENERTVTRLTKLEMWAREQELARMLGGQDGVALAHAKELLHKK